MSLQLETSPVSGRTLSGSDDLDLLFNENDGILVDESLMLDKDLYSLSDEIFSNLATDDYDLSGISQTNYNYPIASPEHSDSGISDGVYSPQYQSDSQSGGSPYRIEELEGVIMDSSADMSSYLIGSDEMLTQQSTIDKADLESVGGFGLGLKLSPNEDNSATLPMTIQDVKTISATTTTRTISTTDSSYPKLWLTDEEKRLLDDVNVSLPTDMPLTKEEERALKTVRRKIRNKISAMDSRKRKKVYVDGLEQRVTMCTKQNQEITKKMAKLENENKSLMEQLKKLQAMVSKVTTKGAHASTCVMVLLLSFALLIAPSFNPFSSSKDSQGPSGVVSRTLMGTDMPPEEALNTQSKVGAADELDENQPIAMRRFTMGRHLQKPEETASTNQDPALEVNVDPAANHKPEQTEFTNQDPALEVNVDPAAIHKLEQTESTNQDPAQEVNVNPAANHKPEQTQSANEVEPSEDRGKPGKMPVVPEVKSTNGNQSSSDTSQTTQKPQERRIQRTVHNDEI